MFVSSMKSFRKSFAILLAAFVMMASVGISITNHICLTNNIASCSADESCCSQYHQANLKSSECCLVKSVYIKANFVSSDEQQIQKLIPEVSDYFLISFSSLSASTGKIKCSSHSPPPERSNRSILLSTSKLSV